MAPGAEDPRLAISLRGPVLPLQVLQDVLFEPAAANEPFQERVLELEEVSDVADRVLDSRRVDWPLGPVVLLEPFLAARCRQPQRLAQDGGEIVPLEVQELHGRPQVQDGVHHNAVGLREQDAIARGVIGDLEQVTVLQEITHEVSGYREGVHNDLLLTVVELQEAEALAVDVEIELSLQVQSDLLHATLLQPLQIGGKLRVLCYIGVGRHDYSPR